MYIKKLELLNFQVIEKFEAEFTGNVYFVTGDNELGKSTLLKAIGALLTGNRDEVLRNGTSKGFAKMVVGDDGEEFDVSLSFTENNPRGTLTIKQKSTGMSTNNVTMLQKIFGYTDFDAVEFSRWSETAEGRRKQIAVVKSLFPVDVRTRIESIDAEVAELKSECTGVNRDVKTFETLMTESRARMDFNPEEYKDTIDITDLLQKQQTNAALIEKAKTVRVMLQNRTEQLAAIPSREKEIENANSSAIAEAERELEEAKRKYRDAVETANTKYRSEIKALDEEKKDLQNRKANAEDWLKKYEANNPEKSDVADLLAKAETHNKRAAMVVQFAERKQQYDDAKAKADGMVARIDRLQAERAELITKAELPISGLSFTDDGLILNGVPFMPGKVSDSQTMEIAAKLIIASNPKVKVFRIARGESLGAKRLETIIDIAKRNGFQGFIEQVQRGQTEMMVEEYTEPEN